MEIDIKTHIVRLMQTITGESQINAADIIANRKKDSRAKNLKNGIFLLSPYAQNEIACIAVGNLIRDRKNNLESVDYNDIIESAARKFWRQQNMDERMLMIINQVSALYHESEVANGTILFDLNNDGQNIKCNVEFFNKHSLLKSENIKLIRKILNLTNNKYALVVNEDWEICGIKHIEDQYSHNSISLSVNGLMSWDMKVKNKTELLYRNGYYRIRVDSKASSIIIDSYKKWFSTKESHIETLSKIVDLASKQKHGTSLIIGTYDEMLREARRLCSANKGIRVDVDFKKDPRVISMLTSIDGALLIDDNLNCLAIGVILDGATKTSGNRARGARYNSVCNYIACLKRQEKIEVDQSIETDQPVEHNQTAEHDQTVEIDHTKTFCDKAIGVIISEDKTIDAITSDDFGDIQGIAFDDLTFTLAESKIKSYSGQEIIEKGIKFNMMTEQHLEIINRYKGTISIINFDDPTSRKLNGSYIFINLIGHGKVPQEDYRLIYDFGEITLKKVGNGPCIFQIMEVQSDLINGTSDFPDNRLLGKDAFRTIDVADKEIITLKLAYAYCYNSTTSVRFNALEKYIGRERIEVFKLPKDAMKNILEDLLNFNSTRYHYRLTTLSESFDVIFKLDTKSGQRTVISGLVDQDFSEDKYEKPVFEKF